MKPSVYNSLSRLHIYLHLVGRGGGSEGLSIFHNNLQGDSLEIMYKLGSEGKIGTV